MGGCDSEESMGKIDFRFKGINDASYFSRYGMVRRSQKGGLGNMSVMAIVIICEKNTDLGVEIRKGAYLKNIRYFDILFFYHEKNKRE